MKKDHMVFPKKKLLKLDIYDEAFDDLCDKLASRWARKAEQLRQSRLNKTAVR